MTDNKTTMNTEVRQAYESVKVKVMKVTPQRVLCGSGGTGPSSNGGLMSYIRFGS